MSRKAVSQKVCLAAFAVLVMVGSAQAGPLYWSGSNSWDTATTDWSSVQGGGPGVYTDSAWSSGADATFEGRAGTVSVTTSTPIPGVNSITFTTDGYLLSGGTLTLTGTTGAGNGTMITTGTGTDTIASVIAGSVPLVKYGSGTLVLSNTADTYTGSTFINGGVLDVLALANSSTASSLGAGSAIFLNGNATLQFTGSVAASASSNRTLTLGSPNANTLDASGSVAAYFNGTLNYAETGINQRAGADRHQHGSQHAGVADRQRHRRHHLAHQERHWHVGPHRRQHLHRRHAAQRRGVEFRQRRARPQRHHRVHRQCDLAVERHQYPGHLEPLEDRRRHDCHLRHRRQQYCHVQQRADVWNREVRRDRQDRHRHA